MLKEILPVYQNFSSALGNTSMSGTNTIVSASSNITHKDSVAIQLSWTGTPTGQFYVEGSLDYNPGGPQSSGTANTGTWTAINAVDQSGNPPVASGAAGQILMNLNQLGFPWIRVRYVNSSGSGTLSGFISGKSLG